MVCLKIKQFPLGFSIGQEFNAGLAITLVTVGSLAALSVRTANQRFSSFAKWSRRLPYASVGLMSLIGTVLAMLGLRIILR